jgi:SAM-dependent methyltransferase
MEYRGSVEIDYNINYNYWAKRYKDKGGEKTVGQSSWSDEQYSNFILESTPILKDILQKHCTPTSILDFGCGIGRWIPLLESIFDIYFGVDIIEDPIKQCQKYFPNSKVALMKNHIIPAEKESFDNVWTYVTLQHIVDLDLLDNYVHQFYNLLKTNGICIITENCSGNRTNDYMSFRPPEVYINIFEKNKFVLETKYKKINKHATMVFSKK